MERDNKRRKKKKSDSYKKRRDFPSRAERALQYSTNELKFHDTFHHSHALVATSNATGMEVYPSGAATVSLNSIAQGNSNQTRIGSKVLIKKVWLQGMISIPALGSTNGYEAVPDFFVALVLHKDVRGVQINSEDVYENPSAQNRMGVMPLRNLNYSNDYRVLRSKLVRGSDPEGVAHTVQVESTPSTVHYPARDIPFTLSWEGEITSKYYNNNTTGTIAAMVENSVMLLACCSEATRTPSLTFQCRVRFEG